MGKELFLTHNHIFIVEKRMKKREKLEKKKGKLIF